MSRSWRLARIVSEHVILSTFARTGSVSSVGDASTVGAARQPCPRHNPDRHALTNPTRVRPRSTRVLLRSIGNKVMA